MGQQHWFGIGRLMATRFNWPISIIYNIILCSPNKGHPRAAATPWNISKTPKAFVSNSSPVSSTIMVDLRDAKQAIKKNAIYRGRGTKKKKTHRF